MPYYLVPFVRPEGRSRGRRPRGYDHASHSFVTLGTGESARALIWFDDPFTDPEADKVADGADETLALTTRTTLGALVKDREYRDVGQRFDHSVAELLKRPPAGWSFAPLRPSVRRRRYEVWLGPGRRGQNLFYSEPVSAVKHSKTWIDTFNRANGALAGSTLSGGGATWVDSLGILSIVSNQVQASAFDPDVGYVALVDTDTDTADMYSSVQLVSFTRPVPMPGNSQMA